MFSTEWSEEEQAILAGADRLSRSLLAPLAEEMDDTERWPDTLFPQLGAAGYLGLTAPPALGGAGMSLRGAGLVGQAMSRYNPAVALSWGAHEGLALHTLLRGGTPEQQQRWIPAMCRGEAVGALGLTEPGAGSDALGSMRTTARREGDFYRLQGRKMWITNGPIADRVVVYARTAPDRGSQGISALVVERGMPGFSVAQSIRKIGFRGSPTGELVFDDCMVPVGNRLGEENAGVGLLMGGLDIERALIATLAIGMGERALQLSLEYARTREQFGRPIAQFQLIQGHLADMYVALESARGLTDRALRACDRLAPGEAGRGEIHRLTAAAILCAARSYKDIADRAAQIHGAMGYSWEGEVSRLYRAAKLLEIGAGTNEVRQLIVAGELLKGA